MDLSWIEVKQYTFKESKMDEVLWFQTFNPCCFQVHLVTCSAFLSSANKYEFLDMGYVSSDLLLYLTGDMFFVHINAEIKTKEETRGSRVTKNYY